MLGSSTVTSLSIRTPQQSIDVRWFSAAVVVGSGTPSSARFTDRSIYRHRFLLVEISSRSSGRKSYHSVLSMGVNRCPYTGITCCR